MKISDAHVSSENKNFPFHAVIGCPHPKPPRQATFERNGDRAVVKCNYTTERFYLTCRNHRWVGTVSNCTKGKKSPFLTSFNLHNIYFCKTN